MATPAKSTPASLNLEAIVQAYFSALADGNLERVPWANDVVLRAPLAVGPLEGRPAVEDYLRPFAGKLGEVRLLETFRSSTRDAITAEALVGPLHVVDKFVIRDGRIVEQQNFYDPRPMMDAPLAGGITTDERALLIERLDSSRERFRGVLAAIPDDLLRRAPSDGGWTALECAEHLVITEEVLLRIIRTDILGSAPNPALPLELQGRDGFVVAAIGDR